VVHDNIHNTGPDLELTVRNGRATINQTVFNDSSVSIVHTVNVNSDGNINESLIVKYGGEEIIIH